MDSPFRDPWLSLSFPHCAGGLERTHPQLAAVCPSTCAPALDQLPASGAVSILSYLCAAMWAEAPQWLQKSLSTQKKCANIKEKDLNRGCPDLVYLTIELILMDFSKTLFSNFIE